MEPIVGNALSREIDRCLMDEVGIPGIVLMENAAFSVANAVINSGHRGRIIIIIGGRNNGGDGLAVMRILKLAGFESIGLLCCDEMRFSGDALINYRIVQNMRLPLTHDMGVMKDAAIIVDALFGTGLTREITGIARNIVEYANSCRAYRIAIDIPSGINGDTGEIMGTVFHADETITVQYIKRGLLLTKEREAVGKISICRIGEMPESWIQKLGKEELIDKAFVASLLPDRRLVCNKGDYGRSLIIAGSSGMSGAAVMAASAALRAGSGLVNAYVPKGTADAFCVRPEIMVNTDVGIMQLETLIAKSSAIGIGCGSGNDPFLKEKLLAVLNSKKPCVIDADALNGLGEDGSALLHENCVLTPHPGEMSRLLGISVAEVVGNPVDTARNYAAEHDCTLLLKSSVSVIASPKGCIRYNTSGNPGLAKGGSGDVLTGIITALLAQGLKPFDAASVGAFLLGSSANKALDLLKNRTLAAGDVIEAVSLAVIDD